mmetsp:Transcript_44481/g.89759  ORF Transcript_44481/g.89759 Transcript_44481/m.89759 type:complete len:86 (-) Transcript_44481:82-339(-)
MRRKHAPVPRLAPSDGLLFASFVGQGPRRALCGEGRALRQLAAGRSALADPFAGAFASLLDRRPLWRGAGAMMSGFSPRAGASGV